MKKKAPTRKRKPIAVKRKEEMKKKIIAFAVLGAIFLFVLVGAYIKLFYSPSVFSGDVRMAAPTPSGPVYESVSSAANSKKAKKDSTLTINKPSGVVTGDFLVAGISVKGGNDVTITPPTDWTLIERTNKAGEVALATYYKVATGSEPADYTWTLDRTSGSARASGGIIRYSGVHTDDPIDVKTEDKGVGTEAVAPSMDTVWNNDAVLAFFAVDGGTTFGTVSGATERFDIKNNHANGPATAVDEYAKAEAGSTGSATAVFGTVERPPDTAGAENTSGWNMAVDEEAGSSYPWAAQHIAIRVSDTVKPSGGSISYTDGYVTALSVPITYTTGTDDGSGIKESSGKLQRATSTLDAGGTCGTFGSFQLLASEADGAYTDTDIEKDHCYKYRYRISDYAGNNKFYTSESVVKVDIDPPQVTITAPTKASSTTITDTTIHVTNTEIMARNVIISASSTVTTDNWNCVQTDTQTVDCTVDITDGGDLRIEAVDEAGITGTGIEADYIIDTDPPIGGSITYAGGIYRALSVPLSYSTGTDVGVGVDTGSGKIQRAEAVRSGNVCGTFGMYEDLIMDSDGTHTDTSVRGNTCYKYQYVISDYLGHTAIFTSDNAAEIYLQSGGGGGSVAVEPVGTIIIVDGKEVRQELDFRINEGEPETDSNVLNIYLNADTRTVRGYAISLDRTFNNTSLYDIVPRATYTLPDIGGLYTVFVKYFSTTGMPSEIISHQITYVKEPTDDDQDTEEGDDESGEEGPAEDTPVPKKPIEEAQTPPLFTRNLGFGSIGEDVRQLQVFLNAEGFTVAIEGSGAPGSESVFFGARTRQAVQALQVEYAKYILDPLGLTRATGFFGTYTRDLVNQLISGTFKP